MQLSDPKTKHIYQKRKIDVESTFGNLKANLGFQRLSARTHGSKYTKTDQNKCSFSFANKKKAIKF